MPRPHPHPHPIPISRHYPDPQHFRDLERLGDEITELAAHIHAATFQLLELIHEFDEQEGWSGEGVNSCAHWLNWKCGMNQGAAREKVRVAHALPDLPLISAAFREGKVSYSKVRAMTRVATPKNEEYLLSIANHGTAHHVERLVSQYRRLKRDEALELENIRHAQRELSWMMDSDGMWLFRGKFTAEQGALIARALEAAMDEMFVESENEPADVSAETWIPSRQAIAVTGWTLPPKPCRHAGLGRKWTTAWQLRCYRAASKTALTTINNPGQPACKAHSTLHPPLAQEGLSGGGVLYRSGARSTPGWISGR